MVTAAGTAQVFHLIPLHRSVCPVSKSTANVLCFFISPKYFLLFFHQRSLRSLIKYYMYSYSCNTKCKECQQGFNLVFWGLSSRDVSLLPLYSSFAYLRHAVSRRVNVKLFKTTNGTQKVQHPCTKSAAPLHRQCSTLAPIVQYRSYSEYTYAILGVYHLT